MANWPKSSTFEAREGLSDPVPVVLTHDRRITLPADVRRALDWLRTDTKSQEILFELCEPGRVVAVDAVAHMSRLEEVAQAEPDEEGDLRLIFSRGTFIRDRLNVSDRVGPHLLGGPVPETGIEAWICARRSKIEIWSAGHFAQRLSNARIRQAGLLSDS